MALMYLFLSVLLLTFSFANGKTDDEVKWAFFYDDTPGKVFDHSFTTLTSSQPNFPIFASFGGRSDMGTGVSNELIVFTPRCNQWQKVSQPSGVNQWPSARFEAVAFDYNGALYLVGGSISDFTKVGEVWKYQYSPALLDSNLECTTPLSLSGAVWSKLAIDTSSAGLVKRNSHSGATIVDDDDTYFVLFGGELPDGTESNSIIVSQDLISWSVVVPSTAVAPTPRRWTPIVAIPGTKKIIFFGGYSANVAQDDLWSFDLETSTWEQIIPNGVVPPARSGNNIFLDQSSNNNNNVFIFGGDDFEGVGLNDVWRYDITANKWNEVELDSDAIPDGRAGAALFVKWRKNKKIEFALYGGIRWAAGEVFQDTWIGAIKLKH